MNDPSPEAAWPPFRGILVPTLTPVAPGGGADLDALRTHADWLVGKAVHGLYPCGSTGEGPRLAAAERREVVAVTCGAAAGRVPVLAGVWGANREELLAEAEHAAGCGAAAVAVTAPVYFRPGADAIFEHFRGLAEASPVGVLVYDIPAFAVPIPWDVTAKLAAECPNVVGVKDSSGDASKMARLCAAVARDRPDFAILTGWDAALLPMLAAGADGGTNATAGVVPELTLAVGRHFREGDIAAAQAAQRKVLEVFDACIDGVPSPEGFRLAAALRGFDFAAGRVPLTDRQLSSLADRREMLGRLVNDL